MKFNISKKHMIIFLIGIVCITMIVGIWLWKSARKTIIIPFGETVVLDSKKEEEDRKRFKLSNFYAHDGKLEITITDSKLYKNPEEAGIEAKYLSSLNVPEKKNTSFLLVTYTVHNVDATPMAPMGFLPTAVLRLMPYGEVIYDSVFKENVEKDPSVLQQPKEGAYYQLPPGESKVIQCGYYVNEDDYKNGKVLLAITTGNDGPIKTALEIIDR